MSAPAPEPGRISTLSRILAWILVVCSVLVAAGMVFQLFTSKNSSTTEIAVLFLALILLMAPLFGFAAIKGRAPRWLSSVETMYDREAERRGISTRSDKRGRLVTFAASSLLFGVGLIIMGRALDLFGGETGWFAAGIFFLAWLIVVLILWRNSKGDR